jgi:hypothetical protein
MNGSGGWIRSPQSLALLWATLTITLVLGACVVALAQPAMVTPDRTGVALSDERAAAQVVDSAKQIVAAARLSDATGGYSFVSCANESDPPYQAAFYMSFRLPEGDSAKYLGEVASTMAATGWTVSPAEGEHFGYKLTKDGVTSVFYRTPGHREFATMRLYGECSNTSDHHNDNPAWTEVAI